MSGDVSCADYYYYYLFSLFCLLVDEMLPGSCPVGKLLASFRIGERLSG